MNTTARSTDTVTITVKIHTAIIAARHVDLVRPVLEYSRYGFEAEGRAGGHWRQETEPFYSLDPAGNLVTAAGLVPRIRRHLRALGHRVRVLDRTRWLHLEQPNSALREEPTLSSTEHRFLDAIESSPRGQIVVERAADIPRYAARIAADFPTTRVWFVTATNERKEEIRRQLQSFLVDRVETNEEIVWGLPRWLLVDNHFMFGSAGRHQWHVVVFLDPESALAKRSIGNACYLDSMFYCFVPADRQLGQHDQLWLEAMCGPVIFRTPHPQGALPDVRVAWLASPVTSLTRAATTYAWKQALWQQPERNALIAPVAQACRDRDRRALRAAGLMLERRLGPRVCVLTESAEHAERLGELLPGWPVLRRGSKPTRESCWIATLTCAVDQPRRCDILMRADGGPGWPRELPFPARSVGWDRALLIDLRDQCDDQARRFTDSRHEAYGRLGWLEQQVHP